MQCKMCSLTEGDAFEFDLIECTDQSKSTGAFYAVSGAILWYSIARRGSNGYGN